MSDTKEREAIHPEVVIADVTFRGEGMSGVIGLGAFSVQTKTLAVPPALGFMVWAKIVINEIPAYGENWDTGRRNLVVRFGRRVGAVLYVAGSIHAYLSDCRGFVSGISGNGSKKGMKVCHRCKKELEVGNRVGRKETCPFCGTDLRVCLNCRFYDVSAYNQCREPQAERVVDKDRSNFCEYFVFGEAGKQRGREGKTPDAKATLEAFFKNEDER